jgi:hypothetical protein
MDPRLIKLADLIIQRNEIGSKISAAVVHQAVEFWFWQRLVVSLRQLKDFGRFNPSRGQL